MTARNKSGTEDENVKIAIFLNLIGDDGFAANKSSIRDISDRFNMSLSTFHSVEMRVISFFIDILPKIINFPRTDYVIIIALVYPYNILSGFPNILDSVDGSYIEIRTPSHKLKSTYTNRHDIPCVTLQGICNAKKKFIDVFTGPPGKIHDSRIFKLSFISSEIATLTNNGHYHLIGDSAYPIREWLLTPFKDYGNVTEQQKNYNKKLSRARVKIENSFVLLKGRFRQLQRVDFHKVLKSSQFILACCVLHNVCIEFNDNCEEIAIEDNNATNINNVVDRENELKRLGELKRQYVCQIINNN
ncbi:hypothetical protein RI129_003063 [Pyrocoelia pectoralis]|uniref:DDE Tnp4 domain-containing protein n=1 Tax=Pyrocoelia pectoralis TaxID=417401 RepID=A0AAN7ZU22_9COLE